MKRFAVLTFLPFLLLSPPADQCGAGERRSADAETHCQRGVRLKRSDEYDAALDEFERAIACEPDCIAAHREYQNILLDFGFQEDLMRDYGARVTERPVSPGAHYLYGRLLDDPGQQVHEFENALRIEPGFFWGHFGKAIVALHTGRSDLAEEELTAALAADPSSPSARWAMGCVESAAGRHEAALEIFKQLLREDDHSREAYQSALSECIFLERFKTGGRISERASRLFPRSAVLLAFRGYFLSRAGRCGEAIEEYEKAIAIEPLPFIFMRDLRCLYVKEKRYEKAIDLWRVSFGSQIMRKGNRLLPLWRQLEDAAGRAAGGRGPARRREFVRALTAMGWWAEAASIDGTHAMTGARGSMLSDAAEGERLLTLLSRYGKRLGAETAQRKRRIPFSTAVAGLESDIRSTIGRPLVLQGAIRSAPGVRWLGNRPRHPQPLLDIMRGGNREIILFENVFGRRINFEFGELLRCELRRRSVDGFSYWSVTCCLSGDGVMDGESGLAYPPFNGYAIFYDAAHWNHLCELRRRQRRNPLEHDWFLEEVSGARIGPKVVRYSRMLERRLFEMVCREVEHGQGEAIQGSIENLYTAVVAEHEYQHLLDLRRHLPVWEHPFSCLLLAFRNLFLPSLIEACLEERAILRSLACCPDPLLALLAVHAQLSGGEDPHHVASRRALSRIVEYIAARPEEFPSIDCRRNILNQIYRLGGENLRSIAREMHKEARGSHRG